MSIKVMSHVWEHSQHKGGDLLLLLAIADHADDHGQAFPSIKRLAQKTRMTERNVQFVLKRLMHSQELVIRAGEGPHGCHLFTLTILNTCPCRGEHDGRPEEYCAVCNERGTAERRLDRHHIIPKSWGGADVEHNLITLCSRCHDVMHTHLAALRKEVGSPSLPYTAQTVFAQRGADFSVLAWVMERIAPEKISGEKISGEKISGEKSRKILPKISPEPSLDPSEELKPKIPLQSPKGDDREMVGNLPAVQGEKKPRPQPTYPPGFLQFWALYPPSRRASKPSCLKLWHKGDLEARTEEVCAKIEGLKITVWQDREPHFIPMTLTWLSQGRYDDDPITAPSPPVMWAWARELEEDPHATA